MAELRAERAIQRTALETELKLDVSAEHLVILKTHPLLLDRKSYGKERPFRGLLAGRFSATHQPAATLEFARYAAESRGPFTNGAIDFFM